MPTNSNNCEISMNKNARPTVSSSKKRSLWKIVEGFFYEEKRTGDCRVRKIRLFGIPVYTSRRETYVSRAFLFGVRVKNTFRIQRWMEDKQRWMEDKLAGFANACKLSCFYQVAPSLSPLKAPVKGIGRCLVLKCECMDAATRYGVNLGDAVQAVCVKNILGELYPDMQLNTWDRDNLSYYVGEPTLAFMQGWFAYGINFFPGKNILPVYIGTHVTASTRNNIIRLLRFNPYYFENTCIGCRDMDTVDFFRSIGVDAYLSRCTTLTLPRRTPDPSKQTKVFIVSMNKALMDYIPENLRSEAVILDQRQYRRGGQPFVSYFMKGDVYEKDATTWLERYRDEARLVITTAIHCASPCLAMGIPVVLIRTAKDAKSRFGFLEDLLPSWSVDDLKQGKVDFAPSEPDIETLKGYMKRNIDLSIKQARGEYVDEPELREIRAKISQPQG